MTDQELFCKVICAAMFPQTHPMPNIPPEKYPALREMLAQHTLQQLPGKLLQAEAMPQALREQWQREAHVQKLRFGRYLLRQDAVLRLFAQAEIPCAILKGAASAAYYPEPACRSMGDIDLLVRPCDQAKATALLESDGFSPCGYHDAVEQGFAKGSVLVELHTGAFTDKPYSDAANAFLLQHFDALQSKELYGYTFPCMPESCSGLVLLGHLHRHFRDTLGFRQVIDWMMYVDRCLDDSAWNTAMSGLFARYGLQQFAIVITAMCQRYFGLRTEGITWPQQADETLCAALFDHIFAMGNFGRKLEATGKTAASMLRDRTLLQVLLATQKVGVANWPLSQRHPWLRLFAWLHQILLYMYRIITEGYNLSPALVKKERRRVKKTLHLEEKLGLPQAEN